MSKRFILRPAAWLALAAALAGSVGCERQATAEASLAEVRREMEQAQAELEAARAARSEVMSQAAPLSAQIPGSALNAMEKDVRVAEAEAASIQGDFEALASKVDAARAELEKFRSEYLSK